MANLLDIVKKDSTDRSVTIRIIDSSDGTPETGVVYNTSGIDLWYRREGAAKVSITEATLAALTTAHSDGGFLHVGDGEYRLDLPDAAVASGANYVDVGGTVTGMIVIGGRIRLVNCDLEDSVRLGLTALPNAAADAAGGLPVSDAGGLDLDAKLANTNEITAARMGALTDWINGGRLDLLLDALLERLTATRAGYLDNLNGHTPQTGDTYGALPANFGDLAITPTTGKVTVGTNDDKTGYALSTSGVTAVQSGLATATAVQTAQNDLDILTGSDGVILATTQANYAPAKAGDAMALTSGERTTLAAAIEAAIINELDGTAVMQAIADLIADDMTTGDLTVQAIASAVRDAILNRVLSGNHDTAGTPGKILQDVYADTNELQANQGNWVTATGFSTLDAAGVRSAVGLASANLDTQLASIKSVTDKVDTGLEADGSSGYQWTTLALENGPSGSGLDAAGVRTAIGLASANLDTQLSGIVSDIAGIDTGAGTGANTFTIHVQDGDGADLENASVRMILGAENYLVATDANGDVSVSRDNGTWSVAITLPGYSFTPTTLAVSASLEGTTQTYAMTAETAPSSDPGFVTGQSICYDASGTVESGVTVSLQLVKLPSGSTGLVLDSSVRTTTSNGSGYAYFTGLLPGAQYQVGRADTAQQFLVTVPSDATSPASLPSFFGVDS